MPVKENESGLLVVTSGDDDAEEKRDFGPLEIHDEGQRQQAYELLQQLHTLLNHRGGIVLPGHSPAISKSRVNLLTTLAEELLGEVDFEELC